MEASTLVSTVLIENIDKLEQDIVLMKKKFLIINGWRKVYDNPPYRPIAEPSRWLWVKEIEGATMSTPDINYAFISEKGVKENKNA